MRDLKKVSNKKKIRNKKVRYLEEEKKYRIKRDSKKKVSNLKSRKKIRKKKIRISKGKKSIG